MSAQLFETFELLLEIGDSLFFVKILAKFLFLLNDHFGPLFMIIDPSLSKEEIGGFGSAFFLPEL